MALRALRGSRTREVTHRSSVTGLRLSWVLRISILTVFGSWLSPAAVATEPICFNTYCGDVGVRCSLSGTDPANQCCNYACVPDPSCAQPANPPFNTCEPPTLFDEREHQGPVRADPGDLLMLAGHGLSDGDVVVYKRLADTAPLVRPPSVPAANTVFEGTALHVHYANVPHSLTFVLPSEMTAGYAYGLWVYSPSRGQWTQGIRINDARPMWITPDTVYRTGKVADLPREIKVVGRNLQPQPGSSTIVRLVRVGEPSTTYSLTAADDGSSSTAIEHFIARVALPTTMTTGTYQIQVARDGTSFVTLVGQNLTVLPTQPTGIDFHVGSFGGCSGNDSNDDTTCILNAIEAAASAGGGNVTFGNGNTTWLLGTSPDSRIDPLNGIVLPLNVHLVGAGATKTRVRRELGDPNDPRWLDPVFTVLGRNTIRGIRFEDEKEHEPFNAFSAKVPFIQLGTRADDPHPGPNPVADVVITNNIFDRPAVAVGGPVAFGGFSVRHLFVTRNEFGAYSTALYPSGNGTPDTLKYTIEDSVVAFNTFKPGSYFAPQIGQGTIATQFGAAKRLDFSGNVADGVATTYLGPSDVPGWRAGFFFHMHGNHERVLLSQNRITCAGDKAGDGEAIALDQNQNTFGFDTARTVLGATATSVTVSGPMRPRAPEDPYPENYYSEHWIQVAEGPGVGQVRKVVSYTDPAASLVTFTVSPAWDVVPSQASEPSRITVAREYWQVYTVDNILDERAEPTGCTHGNANAPEGGRIAYGAMSADGAIEGNVQYQADGVSLHASYSEVEDPEAGRGINQNFNYFIEIRGNTLDDEYEYEHRCSWSGINLRYGAGPESASPVEIYGVSIGRNRVTHADGLRGGAISLARGWFAPPSGSPPLSSNVVIHNNDIRDVTDPPPDVCSGTPAPACCETIQRVGIQIDSYPPNLPDDLWAGQTTLFANTFTNVPVPVLDNGLCTVTMTPTPSCDPGCGCD